MFAIINIPISQHLNNVWNGQFTWFIQNSKFQKSIKLFSPVWNKRVTPRGCGLNHGHSKKLVKSRRNDNVGTFQGPEIIGSVFERTEMNDPRPEVRLSLAENFRDIFERLTEDGDFEVEVIVVDEAEENFEKRFRILVVLPTVRPDDVQRILDWVSLLMKRIYF